MCLSLSFYFHDNSCFSSLFLFSLLLRLLIILTLLSLLSLSSLLGISEQNVPAELFPQYTTIEYYNSNNNNNNNNNIGLNSPTYIFVIDTVLPEEEMLALSTSISQMLSLMPENAKVGLITFGTQVHVYELGM